MLSSSALISGDGIDETSYDNLKIIFDITGTLFAIHHFLLNYKWAQKVRISHNTRIKRLSIDKHSSLFKAFVSYEEIEELRIRPLGTYSQHIIFFLTYDGPNKLLCYITLY